MLTTDREDLYERVLFLRDHGRVPGDTTYCNTEIAFKYKMSSMQAALGLGQIERIEELVARKRQIFRWYEERLGDVRGIQLNSECDGVTSSYWFVTFVMDALPFRRKEHIIKMLANHHIDSRPFFQPLSSLPAYAQSDQAELARQRNRVSYRISPSGVNLPSGMNLDEQKVDYVCGVLRNLLR